MDNYETKHIGMLSIISAVALIISAVTMTLCFSIRADVKNSVNEASPTEAEKQVSADYMFSANDENGYIVIRDKSGKAVHILTVPTAQMSESDRKIFDGGLFIMSQEELDSLIADYEC